MRSVVVTTTVFNDSGVGRVNGVADFGGLSRTGSGDHCDPTAGSQPGHGIGGRSRTVRFPHSDDGQSAAD